MAGASQIINVIVNSKGAVTVKKELDAIGDSARSTTTYLNGLRAILAAALTFSGASQILETVDSFTQLQNRLKLVADGTQEVTSQWNQLLNVANKSYSTIDGTVNLYYRVAQAYKAWGESAESALEFTELFQKSAILSGSTMQTTAQAVYQFSQALNKGKLDGDEFRSVLEGLPYVANLIQKSLGVTRAELYEMSREGKISVDRIKQAFEDAAKTIRSDFANITPTIGMALTVLRNNWVDFIGDIQNSTGIFSGLAQLILLVANNFQLLAVALSPVMVALAFLAGRLGLGLVVLGFKDMIAAIRLLIPMIWSLNAALLANPFVLAAVAIAAVVAAIVYFRNEIGLTNEFFTTLWTTVTGVFNSIMAFLAPVTSMIMTVVDWFLKWNLIFIAISKIASITKADILALFAAVSSGISSTMSYFSKALTPVFKQLIALGKAFFDLVMEIVQLHIDVWVPVVEAVLAGYKLLWNYIEPALKNFLGTLTEILQGWQIIAKFLTTNFLPAVKAVFEGWIFILEKVMNFINSIISALRTAIALMKQVTGAGGGGGGGKAKGANYGAQFYAGEFNSGGGFKVGGTGAGRDTTAVSFRANRGERVTVETQKQQRQNDNAPVSADVNVPVQINNFFDPNMIPAANESAKGQRSIINAIKMNRDEVAAVLGVS